MDISQNQGKKEREMLVAKRSHVKINKTSIKEKASTQEKYSPQFFVCIFAKSFKTTKLVARTIMRCLYESKSEQCIGPHTRESELVVGLIQMCQCKKSKYGFYYDHILLVIRNFRVKFFIFFDNHTCFE